MFDAAVPSDEMYIFSIASYHVGSRVVLNFRPVSGTCIRKIRVCIQETLVLDSLFLWYKRSNTTRTSKRFEIEVP